METLYAITIIALRQSRLRRPDVCLGLAYFCPRLFSPFSYMIIFFVRKGLLLYKYLFCFLCGLVGSFGNNNNKVNVLHCIVGSRLVTTYARDVTSRAKVNLVVTAGSRHVIDVLTSRLHFPDDADSRSAISRTLLSDRRAFILDRHGAADGQK